MGEGRLQLPASPAPPLYAPPRPTRWLPGAVVLPPPPAGYLRDGVAGAGPRAQRESQARQAGLGAARQLLLRHQDVVQRQEILLRAQPGAHREIRLGHGRASGAPRGSRAAGRTLPPPDGAASRLRVATARPCRRSPAPPRARRREGGRPGARRGSPSRPCRHRGGGPSPAPVLAPPLGGPRARAGALPSQGEAGPRASAGAASCRAPGLARPWPARAGVASIPHAGGCPPPAAFLARDGRGSGSGFAFSLASGQLLAAATPPPPGLPAWCCRQTAVKEASRRRVPSTYTHRAEFAGRGQRCWLTKALSSGRTRGQSSSSDPLAPRWPLGTAVRQAEGLPCVQLQYLHQNLPFSCLKSQASAARVVSYPCVFFLAIKDLGRLAE